MNIFGPKQRGKLTSDPGLKECKVVLSRVDDFSNPPKVDETIVKEEIDDDGDDDDEEHELRIDEEIEGEEEEEEEEEYEDYKDDSGVGEGMGAGANSFLTLKPPAAVMNMVNLPPPLTAAGPPLPPTLHPVPTLNLRPLAPAPPMPQQIQLILNAAAPQGGLQPILTGAGGPATTHPVLISTQPITSFPREPIVIKPVERRRAPPQAKFPTDDFYIPDNNSNNVVNKEYINPPPNEEEVRTGFCQRTISDGRQRLICTT